MKHIIKQMLLMVLMTLVSLSASADTDIDYDFEEDGVYYKVTSYSDFTCSVVAGDEKYTGDIVIPSTVTHNTKTVSVTGVGKSAFRGCTSLTSIEIPNSVISIGADAFYCCTSLKSANMGNGVTSMGDNVFSGCTSLATVKIGEGVTIIGKSAFQECTSLTSIDIPNSVTDIGDYAFDNCTSLAFVKIGNGVTSIGYDAFSYCISLTSVKIGNNVTIIGDGAFSCCTSLTSVSIGNGVTSIYDSSFYMCPISTLTVGNTYAQQKLLQNNTRKYKEDNTIQTLIIASDFIDAELESYLSVKLLCESYYYRYFSFYFSDYKLLKQIIIKTNKALTWNGEESNISSSQYANVEVLVPTENLSWYQTADIWKNFWGLKGGAENYEATGISNVATDKNNKPDAIYDIQGRKLTTPQRGLNIINGKKVLVK